MHKTSKLNNNLTVITDRMPNMHSMTLGLWVKTGGRYEPDNLQGISHFLEHMLFKGTKTRNYKQIKEEIEGVGGIFNAFTSEEYTCYYIKIVSKYLERAIDVLSDMLINSTFENKEIDKERNVIVEEIRMYMDLPNQYVHELLDALLWPEHPLGRSLLGTFDTVGRIKRNDLIGYMDKYHAPLNITAVACGDIEHDNVIGLLKKHFRHKGSGEGYSFKKVKIAQKMPQINLYDKDTAQTHICLGTHAATRLSPQRYAQGILNLILGGNMSSRLFNEVREKRCLAYEIASGTKEFIDTGSLFIHAGVDTHKAAEAVSVIISELVKLKEKYVEKEELVRAKEYFKGQLLMGLEDTMSNMLFLGEQATSIGKILTKDEIIAQIEKVTLSDVKKTAKALFANNSLNMAVIGPKKQIAAQEMETKLQF
ncbi:MAG: insulinase family protein [Candidatus Omnitrophica bacterium]|nr:insulinase family protein [Candidatus Omnitrophota bacterium]